MKELHIGENINDLIEKAKVDEAKLRSRSTNMLCISAGKLLREARKHLQENDEEKAFVGLMKFVELYLFLKRRKDFKDDALEAQARSAVEEAESLKKSLLRRYSALKEAKELKKAEEAEAAALDNVVRDLSPPAKMKPVRENVAMPNSPILSFPFLGINLGRIVECRDLHLLVQRTPEIFILIDVRPRHEFLREHIEHSKCMNIPEEILKPGIPESEVESKLSSEALCIWKKLIEVDFVILLDYCTEDENALYFGHPLRVVEELIWMNNRKHLVKEQPKILKGGFKEWMLSYPFQVSNASRTSVIWKEDMELIAEKEKQCSTYPNLDNVFGEVYKFTENSDSSLDTPPPSSPSVQSKNANIWISDQSSKLGRPSVNRQTKPRCDIDSSISSKRLASDAQEAMQLLPKSNQVFGGDLSVKHTPEVNRKLKPPYDPSSSGDLPSREGDIIASLNEEKKALRTTVSAEEECIEKELEFEALRMRKELEAEESKREEIQKQEQILLENIDALSKQSAFYEARYYEMKEENERMKRQLEEQGKIDSENMKNISAIESVNEDLYEKLKKLRLMKEVKKAKLKPHPVVMRDRYKAAIMRENEINDNLVPKEIGKMPSATFSREDGSDSGGSRLSRSYSSPNIAQLIEKLEPDAKRKYPVPDRSLKPKFENFSVESNFNSVRIRNLNPTYGTALVCGATGLRNMGNTCFMNSTIQCLSNTKQISRYFQNDEYRKHLQKYNKQKTNGKIAEELSVVIKALWLGHYKNIYPYDFKNVVSKYITVCKGQEQQDAHEFFIELLDKLHGDLNQGEDIGPLPNIQSLSDREAADVFWSHHRKKNRSKISDLFEGLLKSTLQCSSCGRKSDNYEIFSCISLPIAKIECTLQDCLDAFMKTEIMSGEAAWDCPSCKQKKEAKKILSFCKLPGILVIHLKRFSFDGIWRKKLRNLVHFPMELTRECYDGVMKYNLYGVVNHIGNHMEAGHYTAYCRNYCVNRWFAFNDINVFEISASKIVSENAYMLFYSASK